MNIPDSALKRANFAVKGLSLPDSALGQLVSGALWFEYVGGTPHDDYWAPDRKITMRDEFFAVANSYFVAACSVTQISHRSELAKAFRVPFLFHVKSNAQSVRAIDQLCSSRCYSDAFSVIRTLHSRVNLLILFSLNPFLFDEWLRNPKDPMFLDGKVREILRANGIPTMEHMYEFYSEIIHGQAEALADVGYLTEGVFPEVPAIMNQVYVSGKFLLAAAGQTLVSINKEDFKGSRTNGPVDDLQRLYTALDDSVLPGDRLEHLQTVIANDRHWIKKGKEAFEGGGAFSSERLSEQISKFYRAKQPKRLRTPYDRRKPLAEQDDEHSKGQS